MHTVKEIVQFIAQETTFDGRIAPDYTNSYQLKRMIDELVVLATVGERLADAVKAHE